jgi:predicted ATP-dependent serine protease
MKNLELELSQITIPAIENNLRKRGRPATASNTVKSDFDPTTIKTFRGSELTFGDAIFQPIKTGNEVDVILSTEGGLMPATNMILVGAPGSGKTTVALDMLADMVEKGNKCLFISAEMDEISYFKYCKRLPKIAKVPVLFLNNYTDHFKETLDYILNEGYDAVCIDSIAEVIESFKIVYRTTESAAEKWLLELQQKHKKGENKYKYYTSFINIQQVTKAGEFVGSNRLKHMMDAMMHVDRSRDGLERSLYFSKNRDCDKDYKVYFTIINNKVHYSYETKEEEEN